MYRIALHAAATTVAAQAQTTTQIPLNYNFNGIIHAGEAGLPDDPMGFRSISDRALDFAGGVPAHPLLAGYNIVSAAGTLDIVHLGNRNTVDNGNWMFDTMPDGDDIGVQPTWLMNVDQTGPQTTTLGTPIQLETTSTASFLFQVSNGGGAFDVEFTFQNAPAFVTSLSAGDWFGGQFLGTGNVDSANPDNNLSIAEGVVNLSQFAGETLTAITFSNQSNPVAAYAILACNVTTDPRALVVNQVPLNYNFNGLVHVGESSLPDDPMGYRSISDRGLDFQLGIPSDPLLDQYAIVDMPGVLDIVHLGDRNTVAGGAWLWDPAPDGDDIGIQPMWLPNSDQTGPQTTTLASPLEVQASSEATFIYQISNGGGDFDVTFAFASGGSFTETLSGGDWFGGSYLGTAATDIASPSANLSLTEGRVDLSAQAGEFLTAITFSNSTNINAGIAIVACNIIGTELGTVYCSPAVANSTGVPATIQTDGSSLASANNLTLTAAFLPQGSFGFFLTSQTQGMVMNPGGSQGNLCLGGAIGRYVGPGQIQNSGTAGQFSLALNLTQHPTPTGLVTVQGGQTWNFQSWYRDAVGGMATSNFTNARSITFQ